MDDSDFNARFTQIVQEETRRARAARDFAARFVREEISSSVAPGNLPVHDTHQLPSIEDALRDGTAGYCLRCCAQIRQRGMVTDRGATPCPGKRTVVIDDAGVPRWSAVPEVQ